MFGDKESLQTNPRSVQDVLLMELTYWHLLCVCVCAHVFLWIANGIRLLSDLNISPFLLRKSAVKPSMLIKESHLYGWICTCMLKQICNVLVKGQAQISLFVRPSPGFSLFLLLLQNSIRHNLSLHSRFVRVQNEGTGKSSWWMLNPEGGKSGKSPRRRAASMDNNSKFTKSRGRAAKKKVNKVHWIFCAHRFYNFET